MMMMMMMLLCCVPLAALERDADEINLTKPEKRQRRTTGSSEKKKRVCFFFFFARFCAKINENERVVSDESFNTKKKKK